jgi:hypothetical protein
VFGHEPFEVLEDPPRRDVLEGRLRAPVERLGQTLAVVGGDLRVKLDGPQRGRPVTGAEDPSVVCRRDHLEPLADLGHGVAVKRDDDRVDAVEDRVVVEVGRDEVGGRADLLDGAAERGVRHLVAETDAERRNLPVDERADERHLIVDPRAGVGLVHARRASAQHDPVGAVGAVERHLVAGDEVHLGRGREPRRERVTVVLAVRVGLVANDVDGRRVGSGHGWLCLERGAS